MLSASPLKKGYLYMLGKRVLVIDIGNTQIVFGVFLGDQLKIDWRINADKGKSADDYAAFIQEMCRSSGFSLDDFAGVVISSVVPPLENVVAEACEKNMGLSPMIVGEGTKTGMPMRVESPHEVGTDRIINTLAAYHLMGQACIVIDFGTATTFDCVSGKGEFLGGVIMPGIGISAEALFQSTSILPRVEIAKPKSFIGKNTVHCMQSGIFLGYVAMVEGMVAGIVQEMDEDVYVMATGGIAGIIAPETKVIQSIDRSLTLKGLKIIYDLNQ